MNADSAYHSSSEAELAVQSSISVREQYKSRLKALLGMMMPAPVVTNGKQRFSSNNRSLGKQACSSSGAGLIQKMVADIPQRKQMCVLGDWLLLLRAASVNVVECIQSWRQVVHHGKPHPFLYGGVNYVLAMCDDTDFLDQNSDLVEWLGFRLHRNPFIIREALDDKISQALGASVRAVRSGKYWTSTDWQRRKQQLSTGDPTKMSSTANHGEKAVSIKTKAQWKSVSPPQALVKPLSSIVPEDDEIDGSRIETAQHIVLDEEALHGRASGLKTINQYLDDSSNFQDGQIVIGSGKDNGIITIYEELTTLTAQVKTTQLQYSRCDREKVHALLALQDLNYQTQWTQQSIKTNLTLGHVVWKSRESHRQETMRVYKVLETRLMNQLQRLDTELIQLKEITERQQDRLHSLQREKEKERVAKHERTKREKQGRQNQIRQKTVERSNAIKSKRNVKLKKVLGKISPPEMLSQDDMATNIAANQNDDFEVSLHSMSFPNYQDELENKRQLSIYEKENERRNRKQVHLLASTEKERRRAENAMMKLEDNLVHTLESQYRAKNRLKELRTRRERIASTSIFSCAHEISGKKFRISIFEHFAKGYLPDGIRIVAYDPVSSTAFPLVMSKREYNSLGYGKTPEGLRDFCKWLCLLYEKRKRQFRLIWSGSACPPPLRVRELDNTLLCVHKEGLKTLSFNPKHILAAVYVRSSDCSKVHFVISEFKNQDVLLVERTMESRQLLRGDAFEIRHEESGQAYIVWKHLINSDATISAHTNMHGSRIYSGDMVVNRTPMVAHVFDANPTEYILELRPRKIPKSNVISPVPAVLRMVLLKRSVNPYSVRLPSLAFHDLVASIQFEKRELNKGDADATEAEWTPVVGSEWMKMLSKYVRVLRLAKFGCKIDGQFYFVKLFIVQQKTEYRSHLLMEFTWISSAFEKDCARISIRVSLSDYLRCADAMRQIVHDSGGELDSCLQCHENQHHHHITDHASGTEATHQNCPSRLTTNATRLHELQTLLATASISLEMLDWLYQGLCDSCNVMMEPMLLVLCNLNPAESESWIPFLSHYFRCYDIGHAHTVGNSDAQALTELLFRERIVVLYNVVCGPTVSAANVFIHSLHWALYPDHHDLPVQVVLLTGDCAKLLHEDESANCDPHLLDGMKGLANAIHQFGELEPIPVDHDAMKFEAYLESEALLVEAARIILEPNAGWRKPGETVGASSWPTAISFLAEPLHLQLELHRSMPSAIVSESVKDLMQLYEAHPKWPRGYEDVRTTFHALLAIVLHFSHVQQLLEEHGGLLTKAGQSVTGESCNLLQDVQMIQLGHHASG